MSAKKVVLLLVVLSIFLCISAISDDNVFYNQIHAKKSSNEFAKYTNAKSPSGKGMGFVPVNIDYENTEIINKLKVKGSYELPSFVDYSANLPQVGDQGSEGSCVTWATGYYYKTYHEYKQYGWNIKDPRNQISPYFLWNNHGGGQFFNSMDLMRGWGAATMASYPSYGTVTEKEHFKEAEKFKILNYTAVFTKSFKIDGLVLKTSGSNNINIMKQWLANGDMFVIGIPIMMSFYNYSSGVYDIPDASKDPFQGLHAVCVVGYDEYKKAFKVVNSWGTSWGENGFIWFGENFMKKYVLEMWVMVDETGNFMNDYDIIYSGIGKVVVDSKGIHLTYGGAYDGLKILNKKGVLFGNPIPLIETDGSFDKFYSDAPIDALIVKNSIGSISTTNAIKLVSANQIGKVKMAGTANSSWDYFTDSFGKYNCFDYTTISAPGQATMYSKSQIDLVGVILNGFTGNTKNTSIRAQTKKYAGKNKPDFYSESGIVGDIKGSNIISVSVSGGNVGAKSIVTDGSIKDITAKPASSKIKFLRYGTLAYIIGGSINCPLIKAGGEIKSISAYLKTLRSENNVYLTGGYASCEKVYSGLMQSGVSKPVANISKIYASLGVFGRFMAGAIETASNVFQPTFAGSISSISTDKPSALLGIIPTISGEGWSKTQIKFKGGDHIQFKEYYY